MQAYLIRFFEVICGARRAAPMRLLPVQKIPLQYIDKVSQWCQWHCHSLQLTWPGKTEMVRLFRDAPGNRNPDSAGHDSGMQFSALSTKGCPAE